MDAARFDAFALGLGAPASRRAAGRYLAWLGLARLLAHAEAAPVGAVKEEKSRKGRRSKKKTPELNRFGCVDVGGFCRDNGQCCSGICSGN